MLKHETIYEKDALIKVNLPLTSELREHHPGGSFPLLIDPIESQQTAIIGMFVLRPAVGEPFMGDILGDKGGEVESVYGAGLDWAFNVDGLDGGWLVAAGSAVDAFRLGMQYGISDAVIVSSYTVVAEGLDRPNRPAYLWQASGPLSWPHVRAADSDLVSKVQRQRAEWQRLGYLSSRPYPAQIIYSWSGDCQGEDFLRGAIFHAKHPTGEPFECYIITSSQGAEKIRARAGLHDLQDRIEQMLIVLPTVPGDNTTPDLSLLPQLLYKKYDIRIANHDGGQHVLRAFSKAGALHQLNLTLGRQRNLQKVLEDLVASPPDHLKNDQNLLNACLEELPERLSYFFARDKAGSDGHGLPRSLQVASLLSDQDDQVCIAVLKPPPGELNWWP